MKRDNVIFDVTGDSSDFNATKRQDSLITTRKLSIVGWSIVFFGILGSLVWASFAPLDRGVPISGTVAKESNRKTVQHQVGGTIEKIFVTEGQSVRAGDILVRLNSVSTKSALEVTKSDYFSTRLLEARLSAEDRDANEIILPTDLNINVSDKSLIAELELQKKILTSRKASLNAETGAAEQAIAGAKAQSQALSASLESKEQQVSVLTEQLKNMRELSADGFVPRNRLLDLERSYMQLIGSISEEKANVMRTNALALELSMKKSQRLYDYKKEVKALLFEAQKDARMLEPRMRVQQYELEKADVIAPVTGSIVELAVFTEGGVVSPGFKMMEIVPSGDPLIIDGILPVNLIDKVSVGLPVEISFSAFNANRTPKIDGEIVNISADRSIDERSGFPYYRVKVRVLPSGSAMVLKKKMNVLPGMPVELFVKTGERTMLNYLTKPFLDRARSALSED
jgi:protease secretion system membrane fusion protein